MADAPITTKTVDISEDDTSNSGMLRIFKSRLKSINYIFRDGTTAVFAPRQGSTSGHYFTDDPVRIKELEEVANGNRHPHIYVDADEKEIEKRYLDPMVKLREQIREEERAKLIAERGDTQQMQQQQPSILPADLTGKDKDPGVSEQSTSERDFGGTDIKAALAGIGNSKTTAPGSAESNSK